MNDIITTNQTITPEIKNRIRDSISESLAPETKRVYGITIKRFRAMFPDFQSRKEIPDGQPEILIYVQSRIDSGIAVGSIKVELAAIKYYIKTVGNLNGNTAWIAEKMIQGYTRQKGSQQKQARAISVEQLKDVIRYQLAGNSKSQIRDKAIILLGFAGMFRRSELARLRLEDVEFEDNEEGMWITVKRSKTDQEGKGFRKWVGMGTNPKWCPVISLMKWIEVLGAGREDPLFCRICKGDNISGAELSGESIGNIITKHFQAEGHTGVTGHSLRRGAITESVRAGARADEIIAKSGHKSTQMIARYTAEADKQKNDCMRGIL